MIIFNSIGYIFPIGETRPLTSFSAWEIKNSLSKSGQVNRTGGEKW